MHRGSASASWQRELQDDRRDDVVAVDISRLHKSSPDGFFERQFGDAAWGDKGREGEECDRPELGQKAENTVV